MSQDGVMTSRDLNRGGGTTGAARVQQEREIEKRKVAAELAFKQAKVEAEENRKREMLAKMIADEIAKEKKKKTKKAKVKNVEDKEDKE
tara:strand:- start:4149 stop:4415 length:267 start_codon:yes stop_codon:yes gene_type:complete